MRRIDFNCLKDKATDPRIIQRIAFQFQSKPASPSLFPRLKCQDGRDRFSLDLPPPVEQQRCASPADCGVDSAGPPCEICKAERRH
ncbi:hypothetical protein VZT92_005868 [Zoarces viviparus]|uniref:Uncharacterized protein n=1 Tax=Zoarces viviparus TaxID=48416 RepID=A0AAW1FMU8_ZOAVI